MKRFIALFTLFALAFGPGFADAADLGMSVPVFIAHMGMAFARVKRGFPPERIRECVIRTPDGNYAAEYSPEIFLYLYVAEDGNDNLNYAALSFTVNAGANLKSTDGEPQYENLCRQLIFALEENVTEKRSTEILTKLGLFGPVLDGAQRAEKSGKYLYMTRYCESNITLLIMPTL